ncbi:CHAT domain-containing protein [Calothrix rhizosoleniae]|uniref:CHAT domain-containing protein n=1 Tax=Calothrix rhizosoleniae TaxID=888997 RepID=UPI000B49F883|nr:CHAT domain-containing protein [Calothrix rhizosoleniae]
MSQYSYHIIVPNENTVKIKKLTTQSTQIEQLTGKLSLDKITSNIQETIRNTANLKDEQIHKVGEALFEALFDSQLREDFLYFYTEVTKKQKQTLQVILEINEIAMPEVVAYPWELICLPQKYNQRDIHFATNRKLSFFRCRYQLEEEAKLSIKVNEGEQLKIALVVSKPTAEPRLSNVEYQEVQQYLRSLDSQYNQVKFLPVMDSLNSYNILERLEEDEPDIFHFIGHGQLIEENGEDIGQIAFVNDSGKADWKDAKMFSQLFNGHTPKIVILQACETGKQSETNAFSSVASRLMLQGIPVVIAMQYKVSNQIASTFVKEFYSQIIKGNSVDIAVQRARSRIVIENGFNQRDFAIPVIYMNASDGYLCITEIEQNPAIPNNPRLKSLQNRKEQIKSQIVELEKLSNIYTQYIKAEYDGARRSRLNRQIDNYSQEIDELYDKLDNIEDKIKEI